MAASTKDFVEAVIRVSGICQGESLLGSSSIRFTSDGSIVAAETPNLIARRFVFSDLEEEGGNYVLTIYDNRVSNDPVTVNGTALVNPAGDRVLSLYDLSFLFIKTSERCTLEGTNATQTVDVSLFPEQLQRGGCFLLSAPVTAEEGILPIGITFSWIQDDVDNYITNVGPFFLDLIYLARGE